MVVFVVVLVCVFLGGGKWGGGGGSVGFVGLVFVVFLGGKTVCVLGEGGPYRIY